ncbi:hypothetical protein KS4_15230 [Poriferisphaera corsica]|uniref:Uncharacterized protein n=1 Tax=Poriferisphaera corsica TaxID=2528020 RepID=A0A517YTB3_9BACT|nr:PEP-CTERM sorting domain-containing protein [Poriferisphaera corsica]QDU33475.1 hypothetical protein KS4_15230 [Poriferisphaera corsica]
MAMTSHKIRSAGTLLGIIASFGLMTVNANAANLLTNSGFEADTIPDGVDDVAGASGWGSFNFTFTSKALSNTDEKSLKLYGPWFDGGGSGVTQGGFAASEGQQWHASTMALNSSIDALTENNFALIKIEFFDAANNVIAAVESDKVESTSPLDTWTMLTVDALAPVDTVSAQIVLVHVQLDPVAGGAIFFDDAVLEQVVPEPASIALLGLASLVLLQRKQH